jgi:hypothetical protein
MHYHLKKHEGHLPFQCTHCNKEFLQASTLALHIAARHPQAATAAAPTDAPTPSFGCPCCDHTTLTKANAVLHYLRTHCAEEVKAFQATSKDPTNSLTCAACEKVCKSATAYLYHVASANCIARALPLEKQDALKGILGQTSPLSSHEIREREEEVLTRAKAILSKEGVNVAEKRRQNPIAKRVHLLSITSTLSHRSNILDELEALMVAPIHQP